MYLTLIFLPFFCSMAALIFGRKLGNQGACIITVFGLFVTFIFSVFSFYEVALCASPVYIKLMI